MAFDNNSYQTEYKRQNYDRMTVLVPRGKGKIIKDFAQAQGKSVSQVFVEALEHCHKLDLSRSNGE